MHQVTVLLFIVGARTYELSVYKTLQLTGDPSSLIQTISQKAKK